MGRGSGPNGDGGSKGRIGEIAPSRTPEQFSRVGEIEAKHGVLGENKPGATDRINPANEDGVGLASNIMFKKEGGQKGSNPGGTYIGQDGVKRYVKNYENGAQAYSEAVANTIYNRLGIPAPKSTLFDTRSDTPKIGKSVANDYAKGTLLADLDVTPEIADKILDGSAADILTANWDTIGLVNDNIMIDDNGNPIRIDNGGSFLFRAQGDDKPKAVLDQISEWDILANDKKNGKPGNGSYSNIVKAAGYKTFDDIMPRMKEQVKKINQLASETNDFEDIVLDAPGVDKQVRDRILQMLRARKQLLNEKVGINPNETPATPDQASESLPDEKIPTESKFFHDADPKTGIIFASPNREEGSTIRPATIKIGSNEQKNFKDIASRIDKAFKIKNKRTDAIGSWADGAENSTLARIDDISLDQLKAAAAMYGYAGEQKAVIYFKPNPKGKAGLYEFTTVAKDPAKLRENLLKLGIEFHTIVPTELADHYRVYVFQDERTDDVHTKTEMAAQILNKNQASSLVTPPIFLKGDGEFLGDFDSREEGRKKYNQELDSYFAAHPEDKERILGATKFWQLHQDKETPEEIRKEQLKKLRKHV